MSYSDRADRNPEVNDEVRFRAGATIPDKTAPGDHFTIYSVIDAGKVLISPNNPSHTVYITHVDDLILVGHRATAT